MSWRPIDELQDGDKIYAGALIRFYNTDKAVSEGAGLWVEPTDYLVSSIYANTDYFQLTCLSKGEEGNITCVLGRQEGYTLGREVKRMLCSDLYEVSINTEPEIIVK